MDTRGKFYGRPFYTRRQQVSTEHREPGDTRDAATKRNISGPEENRTLILSHKVATALNKLSFVLRIDFIFNRTRNS